MHKKECHFLGICIPKRRSGNHEGPCWFFRSWGFPSWWKRCTLSRRRLDEVSHSELTPTSYWSWACNYRPQEEVPMHVALLIRWLISTMNCLNWLKLESVPPSLLGLGRWDGHLIPQPLAALQPCWWLWPPFTKTSSNLGINQIDLKTRSAKKSHLLQDEMSRCDIQTTLQRDLHSCHKLLCYALVFVALPLWAYLWHHRPWPIFSWLVSLVETMRFFQAEPGNTCIIQQRFASRRSITDSLITPCWNCKTMGLKGWIKVHLCYTPFWTSWLEQIS